MAKAQDTITAGAAAATQEDTTAGKAGTTIEERLKLRGVLPMETPEGETETPEGETETPEGETETPEDETETPEGETETPEGETETSADEDGEIKDGEVEGLSPQAQAKINKRIHKINIRRKNAEEKAEQTESQLKDLGKKIQDENIQAAMKLGFDPNYISAEEAKTLNRFQYLRAWKKFLSTHREGYEGDGKEIPSKNAEQVAAWEAEIDDELLDIGGSARTLALERISLKDADAAVGRKIRLAGANKSTTTKPPKKVNPKPPKLPESNGATRRPPISTATKGKPVFDKTEFVKAGGDKDALEKAYQKIY